MYQLETESPDDLWEVEALYDTCFAPGRELLSSYRLREGVEKVSDLCLIARDEGGVLAAAIRFWPIRIGEDRHRALLLGPIAVHPTRQGEGLGAWLVGETLDAARDLGWSRVILIGDEPYYRRLGLTRNAARTVRFPLPTNPDRLLGTALTPGAFDGVAGEVRRAL